jgi:sterol desaturase/sphingolipid hydroxylase (fatty acid hydroxylase superfamily)
VNKEELLLFISLPLYFIAMAAEFYISDKKERKAYDISDTLMSFWFGIAGATLDLAMKGICFLVLDWCNDHAFISPDFLVSFPLFAWMLVFIGQDFCFYWLHRTEHMSRVFWAVHSNHHSSERYNFAVAIRSSVLQPTYRFLFYIPVALMGFDGLTIMFVYALNQFYQFWLHTEQISKLPRWFEYIFVTPSHHRVHHASNTRYLDKNMGQVLIIWDRMFGTFQEELKEEKPRFGLTKPLQTRHPFKAIFNEFFLLGKDLKRAADWRTRLKYIFAPPGWNPEESRKAHREVKKTKAP